MKATKLPRKEQKVAKLIEEVQALKQEADAKRQEIMQLESALEQFGAQYDAYIRTLQRQRQDLAERVQRCRFLIQHWGEPAPPQLPEAQPPPPRPEPEPPPEEPLEAPPMIELIQSSDNPWEQKRKRVRNFFAQFWHPDAGKQWSDACPDPHLMHQLNAAFKQSQDLVDMLIAIPWHNVWLQRGKEEPIEMQWGRLIDWQEALEPANERLDQDLAELQQHEFYPLLLEKQAADERGEDYFAQLATRERDEISRLEDTLAILQAELEELKHREAKEQGS